MQSMGQNYTDHSIFRELMWHSPPLPHFDLALAIVLIIYPARALNSGIVSAHKCHIELRMHMWAFFCFNLFHV